MRDDERQVYQIHNLQIVARVSHNLLTVTNRRRVHQWHLKSETEWTSPYVEKILFMQVLV